MIPIFLQVYILFFSSIFEQLIYPYTRILSSSFGVLFACDEYVLYTHIPRCVTTASLGPNFIIYTNTQTHHDCFVFHYLYQYPDASRLLRITLFIPIPRCIMTASLCQNFTIYPNTQTHHYRNFIYLNTHFI